jgi:hypothetical protein
MTRAATRCAVLAALVLLAGSCNARREEAPAPVRAVANAYLARGEEENWWETIDPAQAGDEFLLYVAPRVLGPAEGPWTATVRAADGRVVTRVVALRVDTTTGRLTFVGRTASFPPGDYTIDITLDPGGVTHSPTEQKFRFRVQTS